jgi:hypothetical protein
MRDDAGELGRGVRRGRQTRSSATRTSTGHASAGTSKRRTAVLQPALDICWIHRGLCLNGTIEPPAGDVGRGVGALSALFSFGVPTQPAEHYLGRGMIRRVGRRMLH